MSAARAPAAGVGGRWFVALAISLAYVSAELAFNARLLDLMAGTPTECELSGIEIVGRVLSGIGVAILAAKLAARGRGLRLRVFLLACAVSVPVVYWLQGQLVDYLVDRSGPVERRTAQVLLLLSRSVNAQQAEIAGIEALYAMRNEPVGKTFIALLPAFGLSSEKLLRGIEASLPALIERSVRARAGDAKSRYAKDYTEFFNRTVTFYRSAYAPASAMVMKAHVAGDASRANARFAQEMRKAFGALAPPPPGLTWKEFVARPEVKRWLANRLQGMGGLNPACPVSLEWDEAAFRRCVHDYAINKEIAERERALRQQAAELADGRSRAQEGRQAYRAVVVPALALCMSLLFGLLNVIFLCFEIASVALRRVAPAWAIRVGVAAAVALLLLSPWLYDNAITRSAQYASMAAGARASASAHAWIVPVAIDWSIRVEPVAYPAMSALHRFVYRGWDVTFPWCRNPASAQAG